MSANILHKVMTTQGLFYKITARTMGVVRTGFEETSHNPKQAIFSAAYVEKLE